MAPVLELAVVALVALLAGPASGAPVADAPAESVDDLLRLFNVSRHDLEQSRQLIVSQPPGRPAHFSGPDGPSPAAVSTVQQAMRNRSNTSPSVNKSTSAAIQRKQEVYRQVMGFVAQNGRPAVSAGAFASFARPDAPAPELYGQTNVGRVRYLQPSCETPRHTDEELWSSAGSPSMHLFFNLSGVQSQTRHGHQLYVIGAKLRLLKFAEGEANELAPGANSNKQQDWPAELVSEQVEDTPIQTLQSQPFFERVVSPTDEEKIRVSVHNYTRAIKRNRAHKKKLLDSQMALTKEHGYLELDVKLAARWWLAPNGRNFGLSVQVEDADGQRKPASSFFRARNCSPVDGLVTDELADIRDAAWPVLELTVAEVPEGRPIVELPSGVRTRPAADDDETDEHDERRARVHQRTGHAEEQADEASRFVQHRTANNGNNSKQRGRGGMRLGPAVPTLATIEDHDLFATDEEGGQSDVDEIGALRKPANLFIQRIVHHQQQRQRAKPLDD